MRHVLMVLTVSVVVLAGCNWWMGRAALDEPQAVQEPSSGTLDMLGQFGDAKSARFETPAYTGLQQNSFTEVGADTDPDVSPDGKLVVFSSTRHSQTGDIYLKKVEGQTVTRLTHDPANDIQPAWSPDGRFIAFTSDRSGNWDIYVMTADGRKPFQVTNGLAHEIHPSWSPDGARLCYSLYNSRTGQWEIWVVEVANPASRKFVAYGFAPVWCPSESVARLALQQARHRGTQLYSIWTVDLVDDEARYLTEIVPATADMAAIAPAWSPDGTCLAYTTVKLAVDPKTGQTAAQKVEHGDDIWVTTLDGSGRVCLTSDGTSDWSPSWAADGRIYFTSDRSGSDNIWSLKPLDAKLIQATRLPPTRVGRAGAAVPAAAAADAQPAEPGGGQWSTPAAQPKPAAAAPATSAANNQPASAGGAKAPAESGPPAARPSAPKSGPPGLTGWSWEMPGATGSKSPTPDLTPIWPAPSGGSVETNRADL